MKSKNIVFSVLLVIAITSVFVGKYLFSTPPAFLIDFERAMTPLPEWWNDIEAPQNSKVKTYEELLTLWQSEKRCCSREDIEYTNRQFFKAAHQAVLDNTNNSDIVVTAIDLIEISYIDYNNNMPAIQSILPRHFFSYNKRVDRCANCLTGDTIARSIAQTRRFYKDTPKEYKELVYKVLNERSHEISPYVKGELYNALAQLYIDAEEPKKAISVLTIFLQKYGNQEETNGAMKSEIKSARRYLKKLQSTAQ
ncbi:MAG: hypothetical protein JKY11_05690 [Alphaproteobacteria bacterium]|nr:hypothetical protein [Alphaproteobacteria bacterium]